MPVDLLATQEKQPVDLLAGKSPVDLLSKDRPVDLLADKKESTFQPVHDVLDTGVKTLGEAIKNTIDYKSQPRADGKPRSTFGTFLHEGAQPLLNAGSVLGLPATALKAITKPAERAIGVSSDLLDVGLMIGGPMAATKLGNTKTISAASDAIEKIFSPTTVSDASKATEGVIRSEQGAATRSTARTKAELDQHQKLINSLPEDKKREFIAYVEGRNKGVTIDASLKPTADTLRGVFQKRRTELEKLPQAEKMGFVKEYFPHMWQDPNKAEAFMQGFYKQGSSAATKKRSIPTYEEGIAAGLIPKNPNPLDATMEYVGNMDRHIATSKIFNQLKDNQSVKYFAKGTQPSGWMELKGRFSDKAASYVKDGKAVANNKKAYAPEDVARVYNNYISKGFAELGPLAGSSYEKAQKVVNSATMAELGFSAFHASTMAMESMISGVADAVGLASKGKLGQAGIEFGKSIGPWKPISSQLKGKKFEQQYLGLTDHGPDFRKIVNLGEKAGMRAVGKDASMKASAMGSFWNSFKNGSLRMEANAARQQIKDRPLMGTAQVAAKAIARTMDTVAQPLFEKIVPRMKNAAFYDTMKSWIETHPASSSSEQEAAARQIWDSVDNRFGELVQDNLFWNKALKQSMQLMVRSVGWDLGTLREIGGGVKDLGKSIKGAELSPRAQYIIALPIVTGLYNAGLQALKTGKGPEDVKDLYAYQTGGTNPDGSSERAMIPGYMKDVVGYLHSPYSEAGGKIATVPKAIAELLSNKDYRGDPIRQAGGGIPEWFQNYADFIIKQYTPISLKGSKAPGSNIGGAERVGGIRPAPYYVQNPDREKRFKDMADKKAMYKKKFHDDRDKEQGK